MKKIVDKTFACIPDETLRQYIFGMSNPKLPNIVNSLIAKMNNAMLLAFFGLYIVWKECRNELARWEDDWGAEQRSIVYAKRVDDVMENIYCNSILTQETMSFIFTEILLEIRKNPYTPFVYLIKGTVATTKFPKIAELIRVWKINAKKAEANVSVLAELYLDLIESLAILQYMKLEETEEGLLCKISLPGNKVIEGKLSYFIRTIRNDDTEDIYYLYKVEKRRDKVLLEYINFGGNLIYSDPESTDFLISKRDFFSLTCNNLDIKESDNIAKSLKINDFKYIHRLSLCISDSLGDGTKVDLLEKIKEKGGYWESFRNKTVKDVNWDNTVVLLMLEYGPSEVIETVLKSDINAFQEILKSIAIRFSFHEIREDGTSIAKEYSYKELEKEYMEREQREQLYQEIMQVELKKNQKVKNWMRNAKICFMSQFIISKVTETETSNEAFYAESISMKLQKINSAIESNGAAASLGMINKTLERIFRILILFYNGILAYAEARESKMKEYGMEMRHNERVLKETQRACEDAFFDSVRKRLEEKRTANGSAPIKTASLGLLMKEFRELCLSMDSVRGKATEYQEKSMLLNSIIGRRRICDITLYDRIVQADTNDFDGIENYPTDITSFFNKVLKHDDMSSKINVKDPRILTNYIHYIQDLLIFFDLNDDFKYKGKLPVQNIFDPVFPYVVRYSERNENRDKCCACQYIINTDGGFEDTKIKLLTEYDYVMNELYYCIPNAECSTENWWVSPFLISCRKFDNILLGELEKEE